MAWLIDPIDKVHWIFRIDGSQQKIEGMNTILTGETVLPDFKFNLAVLEEDDE